LSRRPSGGPNNNARKGKGKSGGSGGDGGGGGARGRGDKAAADNKLQAPVFASLDADDDDSDDSDDSDGDAMALLDPALMNRGLQLLHKNAR
jgi:hypothetical protein